MRPSICSTRTITGSIMSRRQPRRPPKSPLRCWLKRSTTADTLRSVATAPPANRTFNGRISDVAVFRQALTANQMTNLYLKAVGLTGFPAQIATQPTGATAFAGVNTTQTIQFSVTAVGNGPLAYQWSLGGTPLTNNANYSGATNSTLTLTIPANSAGSFGGNYSVQVTNSLAITNSVNAVLTVVTLPAPPAPALVGEWLNGASNFKDVSGYQPAGTHDGYIVPTGNLTGRSPMMRRPDGRGVVLDPHQHYRSVHQQLVLAGRALRHHV